MSDIISIVSGKGGTGKTITAANLSLALQEFGKQVVCLDTDLDSSNLGLQLGHTPDKNTLENYLRGDINELKAVNVHDSGLLFVPSSLHLTGDAVREDRLNKMIERFSGFTDHIVIDAPPGFNEGFYNSLKVSDRVLVVTNPEFQALQDVMKIAEEAGKHGTDIEGLVLNKLEGLNEETTQKEVETVTGLEVLQKIPYEKEVQKSVHRREPLVADPHSKVGHRFRELAARITGRKFEPPWYSGIVRNVKKLMGR
ncbi:MAG: P-loop NTPase [Candidatus Aenigmatarchaeota archaeon]